MRIEEMQTAMTLLTLQPKEKSHQILDQIVAIPVRHWGIPVCPVIFTHRLARFIWLDLA